MMGFAKSLIALYVVQVVLAMDNLNVEYQWNLLDFTFESDESKLLRMEDGSYIPENNIPMGIEVAGRRIFITVPRWRRGVAASLAYIPHPASTNSPKLVPYPNWKAHEMENGTIPDIVSPFRMRADRCGHLWVLDSGFKNILENTSSGSVKPPTIIVFNLHDDSIERRYTLPESQYIKDKSLFANIVVEDHDCSKMFAYLADISGPGLVVYSWKDNDSWRVTHNYFNIEPTAGEFNVAGLSFQWTDGVFGLALSGIKPDGSSDLYFHPMTSIDEFVVSTNYLKNKELSQRSNGEFRLLGTRGQKGQSSVSFLDQKTGVLFYALINLNAIACWKTSNPQYTMQSQGRVYMSNVTMVFPSDLKVDPDDNMWVLSNRLPIFMYSKLNGSDVNFRILTAPVKDAINGTACDARGVVTSEMVAKIKNHLDSITAHNPTQSTTKIERSGTSCISFNIGLLLAVLFLSKN